MNAIGVSCNETSDNADVHEVEGYFFLLGLVVACCTLPFCCGQKHGKLGGGEWKKFRSMG
jgi:hypothetical protein